MPEDTLNEKLYKAMPNSSLACFEDTRRKHANECERIALQEQIDSLNKIMDKGKKYTNYLYFINKELQSLTNKLNSLK